MNSTLITHDGNDGAVALLSISDLRLALPQREICALESGADIDADETKPLSVGWVHFKQERWPVYCLSPELSLLVIVPKARRSCAVLDTGAGYIGILCDEAVFGIQPTLEQQQPVPAAMRTADSPIMGLIALQEDDVACATNTDRLVAYLSRQVNV